MSDPDPEEALSGDAANELASARFLAEAGYRSGAGEQHADNGIGQPEAVCQGERPQTMGQPARCPPGWE